MTEEHELTRCYKFIHDREQIRAFYDRIIAPHVGIPSRSFILLPIARNKYWSGLSKSQVTVSTRTIYTEKLTFEHFLNILQRYEVAEGLYTDRGNTIPAEAFAFYLTCDPMNEVKAMFSLVEDWNRAVHDQLNSYHKRQNNNGTVLGPAYNGTSKYKSILHKHPIKSFVKLDVDTLDPEHINSLDRFLEEQGIEVQLRVRSKNGYHYLLDKGDQSIHLYNYAKASEWFNIENNALIVIPGTYQGGFPVQIADGTEGTEETEGAQGAEGAEGAEGKST